MKEDKSIFVKVDDVEPVYDRSPFACSWSSGGRPYLKGIYVRIGRDGHLFECDNYSVCDPDVVREDAYRQAFALMNKIFDMTGTERKEAFGKVTRDEIFRDASYEDLVKKLDAWKNEKETIRVRDEVCHQAMQVRFVVTKIITPPDGDVIVNGLKKDGTAIKGLLLCNVKKTGVHVDDLDSYLEV